MAHVSPDPLAAQLANAATLAYLIDGTGPGRFADTTSTDDPCHGDAACYRKQAGLTDTPDCVDNGAHHIDAGFVARAGRRVVVSFRGTLAPFSGPVRSWLGDWLQDAEADPVEWWIGGRPWGHVERGFATAVMELWDGARWRREQAAAADRAPGAPVPDADDHAWDGLGRALQRRVDGPEPTDEILVTGHSKGAAATFLAASLAADAHPEVPVRVVCFAAPLTGDAQFRFRYRAAGLAERTVRYQNVYDLVPYLPGLSFRGGLRAVLKRYEAALAERHLEAEGARHPHRGPRWDDGLFPGGYVPMGALRYIDRPDGLLCGPVGSEASIAALEAIHHAVERATDLWRPCRAVHWMKTIAGAHSMTANYLPAAETRACPPTAGL